MFCLAINYLDRFLAVCNIRRFVLNCDDDDNNDDKDDDDNNVDDDGDDDDNGYQQEMEPQGGGRYRAFLGITGNVCCITG